MVALVASVASLGFVASFALVLVRFMQNSSLEATYDSEGPIALHMAWLTCAAVNKAEHDGAKTTVKYDIEAKTRGKEVLVAMAQGKGGLYQTILDAENRLCGIPVGVDVD